MFILVLVVVAAGLLSAIALGFVVPIWAVVDCATTVEQTARKVLWIVAIVVTGMTLPGHMISVGRSSSSPVARATPANADPNAAVSTTGSATEPAAVTAYDSILKITPSAPDALLARGDDKASACDSTGADHDFRAAIGGAIERMNADSLDPQPIYWQGVGLHRLGDYPHAHVMVREAMHLDSLRGAAHATRYRQELDAIELDLATARTRTSGCRGKSPA
ncbi:MAG TPA: hypothetical protein VN706_18165 [Gemmatimonadaceae bacterium]|nr:hypothetical protein [Gemmatimonadaceae bacterium]